MVEDLEIRVKLSNQSFAGAGGKDVHPNLDIAGVVHGKLNREENSGKHWNFDRVNKQLDIQAVSMGATHVFGIEYLFRPNEYSGEELYGAVGTAYKPKNKPAKVKVFK